MPCPYFEPQQVAKDGQDIHGRLPLFDEYNGWCHGSGQAQPVPAAVRFSGCNHGHPDSGCTVFPAGESRRNRRFHLGGKTSNDGLTLEILVLEIENHTPVRSHSVRYSKADEHLEPEVQDECERAQVLAFCRSYLRRFPHPANPNY
jgi:hypothetical protein